jgi:hypothetical protein
LGTWYLAVIQKKLGTKLFYFYTKKNTFHYYFILSLGPRVHFRGQKLIFWQKKSPPKNKIQKNAPPKNKRSPSLKFKKMRRQKKKIPFSKIQKKINTLFISFKVAHSAQEAPKNVSCRWLFRKLKTIEVGFRGRQCFTMEKSFLFLYQKKKFASSFVLSFGHRVHFRGKKVNF